MNVGLFFGSFNPIHVGHLIIAESLRTDGHLDQVWLVVSPQNPHKEKNSLADEADRMRMCELATEGGEGIYPSRVEFDLPRPSYTIDTLNHLLVHFPGYRFSLIMGQDNLATLHKWKNYRAIVDHYPIVVYPRLGAALPEEAYPNVRQVDAPILEISATAIRKRVSEGKSIRYLVPDAVRQFIDKYGLYLNLA